MSLEKPRPRLRCWGFSLCGLCVGVDPLRVQVGVQVCAVVPNAPPDADKGWSGIPVPPLCEFLCATQNAEFGVFWEVDTVVVVDVCHH
jgi:hypothetical protein